MHAVMLTHITLQPPLPLPHSIPAKILPIVHKVSMFFHYVKLGYGQDKIFRNKNASVWASRYNTYCKLHANNLLWTSE